MKKGNGGVFGRHPIKHDIGTRKVAPLSGDKVAVAGGVGHAKKASPPNANGPNVTGVVVGPELSIPPKASGASINKLPSGGRTNIVG